MMWIQVFGPTITGGPFGRSDGYTIESLDDVVRDKDGSLTITTVQRNSPDSPKRVQIVTYMPGQVTRFVTGEVGQK